MDRTITAENVQFARACTEALEVIYNLSISEYNKIPDKFIDALEEKSDSNYHYEYDMFKPLLEQEISNEAKDIIGVLYLNYLATEEEKQNLSLLQTDYASRVDGLNEKFNSSDNLFKMEKPKEVESEESVEEQLNENTELVEVKESVFKKIITFIKNIFKLN